MQNSGLPRARWKEEFVKDRKPLSRIDAFNFQPGRVLARKYEVIGCLGAGWEGEVYQVREQTTGIELAAKFFFPHRNPRDSRVKFYAKKLYKLRQCPMVIQYHTQETITVRGLPVTFLVSEHVEGELLSEYLRRQPGQRLGPYQAAHLLYALAQGIESIHDRGEYHGDLHTDNIILSRFGLNPQAKLVDMFYWGRTTGEHYQDDIVALIHIFHELVGGRRWYARQPDVVKRVCLGLKRSLISKQFRRIEKLREHLEGVDWG